LNSGKVIGRKCVWDRCYGNHYRPCIDSEKICQWSTKEVSWYKIKWWYTESVNEKEGVL
jgi:hypothetical protein